MDAKSSDLAYELQKPKPASQIIYEHLLNEITSGRIEEGGRIVESELAKMFGAEQSHKYVNSILDKLAAQLRTVEIEAVSPRG